MNNWLGRSLHISPYIVPTWSHRIFICFNDLKRLYIGNIIEVWIKSHHRQTSLFCSVYIHFVWCLRGKSSCWGTPSTSHASCLVPHSGIRLVHLLSLILATCSTKVYFRVVILSTEFCTFSLDFCIWTRISKRKA